MGLMPVQFLLWLTMIFETYLSGVNFLLALLGFFCIPFLILGFFDGLVFLGSSNPTPSILQLLEVFLVIWLTFYLRLRIRYFNYYNLQIDTPAVHWGDMLNLYKEKYNLSFDVHTFLNKPILLASVSYSSFKQLKDEVHIAYQTRGMWSGARAMGRGAKRIVSENPGPTATYVACFVTAGVGLYGVSKQCEIAAAKLVLQKKEVELKERDLDLRERMFKHAQQRDQNPPFSGGKPPEKTSFLMEDNSCSSTFLNRNILEILSDVVSV